MAWFEVLGVQCTAGPTGCSEEVGSKGTPGREASKGQRFPANAWSCTQTLTQLARGPGTAISKSQNLRRAPQEGNGCLSRHSWGSSSPSQHPFRRGSQSEEGSPGPLSTLLVKHEAHADAAGGCHPGHRSVQRFCPTAARSLPSPPPARGCGPWRRWPAGVGMSPGAAAPTPARARPAPNQLSFPPSAQCLHSPVATITPGNKPLRRSRRAWGHRSSPASLLVCALRKIAPCWAEWWPRG